MAQEFFGGNKIMTNTKKLSCRCDPNFLCLKAELLQDRAGKIHDMLELDVWKECPELQEYNTHRKKLCIEEIE